jgi:hypothetical protein
MFPQEREAFLEGAAEAEEKKRRKERRSDDNRSEPSRVIVLEYVRHDKNILRHVMFKRREEVRRVKRIISRVTINESKREVISEDNDVDNADDELVYRFVDPARTKVRRVKTIIKYVPNADAAPARAIDDKPKLKVIKLNPDAKIPSK